MDEDAPSLTLVLIINLTIYIVIPLIMAYRRGYFINMGGKLRYYWDVITKNTANYPKDWTITKTRPLSAFEKYQIQKVVVKFMPECRDGYWTDIILKSGKHRLFKLGENKGYWINDVIHKDNILIRTWQKGSQYEYDVIPIKEDNRAY